MYVKGGNQTALVYQVFGVQGGPQGVTAEDVIAARGDRHGAKTHEVLRIVGAVHFVDVICQDIAAQFQGCRTTLHNASAAHARGWLCGAGDVLHNGREIDRAHSVVGAADVQAATCAGHILRHGAVKHVEGCFGRGGASALWRQGTRIHAAAVDICLIVADGGVADFYGAAVLQRGVVGNGRGEDATAVAQSVVIMNPTI